MKKALFLILALLMIVSMTGCVEQEEPLPAEVDGTSRYGGHLHVRSTERMTGLDPLKQVGTWRYQWTTAVYEPFLTRDSQNNIHPCVCDYVLSSYEENGQAYTDLKVWPRQGYVFSHGYGQVEMDDLVASWNRGLSLYSKIKNYVAPNVVSAQVENDAELGHDVFHITFLYNERNLHYFAAWQTWWPVMPREICEKYADSYIADQTDDAVGTGPYVFTEFKEATYVTLAKREDYVPVDQGDRTGPAATKYGYLDSIIFWYNGSDMYGGGSILSGAYDCQNVIPWEYYDRVESEGIKLTKGKSDQRCWIIFKTNGENNLVAKYPSLRKAIMAAIDYPGYLEFVTEDSHVLEGDNIMLSELYDVTDKFKEADYYGAYNQEVVDKYLAMAYEEGYNGEPVQFTFTGHTAVVTMTAATMEIAGINYEIFVNDYPNPESIVADPSVNLDFYFDWEATAWTPGTLSDELVVNNFRSERVEQIREEMSRLEPTSPEYLALWDEWTDIWVEECQVGYLGAVDWYWWHPKELHINDGGDDPNDQCPVRFFYNTYWEDPENHPLEKQ